VTDEQTKPAEKPKPEAMKIPEGLAGRSERKPLVPQIDLATAMEPYKPAPGVLPEGKKLAMDSVPADLAGWASAGVYNIAFVEGYTFLGYPYLSQLAQIPEYRLIGETIAKEATRRWIEIKSKSDDKSKAKKIAELEEEFDRLGVRNAFKTVSELDSWMGRAHLYLDTGDTDDLDELKMPLGDGGALTERKLKKGSLRALKTVEPVWCYPSRYDAADPLKDNWYRPDVWFVNGKEVHASRLLTFVGRPVPDLMKPAFSFGGLSMSQMAKPYVDNWLQTRQSVNDLLQAFSVMVIAIDLMGYLGMGGTELEKRIDLFNNLRNNRGVMVINKDTEEFSNVSAPLSGLHELQSQAHEQICAVSQIPLVKYTGISPSGLNASSDGEIRVFYDSIHTYQEFFFTPHLTTVFKVAQINLWGAVDPDLTFVYQPLWELDEKELAEKRKAEADTDAVYVESGVISPEESRRRLANDPAKLYGDIDPDEIPEVEGALPGNVRETEREDIDLDEDELAA
jgi:phage-related protein (TIGR01555 family)